VLSISVLVAAGILVGSQQHENFAGVRCKGAPQRRESSKIFIAAFQ